MALLTLVSRVLGFVRDAVTAGLLGGSVVNDALTLAWTVPNAFRRLFGEGALSVAFMPVFARVLEHEGRERAREVANVLVSTVAVGLLLLAGVLAGGLALVPVEAAVSAFDVTPERFELTREFVVWLLPYLAAICVIAQLMGVLHTLGEFRVPALAPILLNVMWIAGALAAGALWPGRPRTQGLVIVSTILTSAVAQFAWHLPRLKALGVAWRPVWPRLTPELRSMATAMGPLLLAMGTGQLNIIVDRGVAWSALPDGGVYHLYLGMRLMQFPLGLVSVALTTAVFPVLNRMLARRELEAAAATTGAALRANLVLCLPAAAGLLWVGPTLVAVLFERGAFTADDTALTWAALMGYAPAIPLLGTTMIQSRALFALGDVVAPMRVALVTVVVNLGLDLLLVGPYGELGLAAATSLTALVHVVLLARVLRVRLPATATATATRTSTGVTVASGAPGMLTATAAMLAGLWLTDLGLGALWSGGPPDLLRLVADTLAGGLVFALAASRLCPAEWRALSALWSRGGRDAA